MERIKRKLGITCDCIQGQSQTETLKMIKEVGFESFFTNAYTEESVAPIKRTADELGLSLNSLHAPFNGINSMWLPDTTYREPYQKILTTIDTAEHNGVPNVVVHISSGWDPPEMNDLGFSRFDSIVNYAMDKGVRIAFENLRLVGNLAYFADRYRKVENIGFCLDIGHQHCYTKTVHWMDIFRDRLLLTHIHDNFGIEERYQEGTDLHYLPFDGTIDYAKMMRDLDRYGYSGDLTLEVFNQSRPEYEALSPLEFLTTAYERLEKISRL